MNSFRPFRLIWAPTGRCLDEVLARTPRAAARKAPAPYRKYLGEIRVEDVTVQRAAAVVLATTARTWMSDDGVYSAWHRSYFTSNLSTQKGNTP